MTIVQQSNKYIQTEKITATRFMSSVKIYKNLDKVHVKQKDLNFVIIKILI